MLKQTNKTDDQQRLKNVLKAIKSRAVSPATQPQPSTKSIFDGEAVFRLATQNGGIPTITLFQNYPKTALAINKLQKTIKSDPTRKEQIPVEENIVMTF